MEFLIFPFCFFSLLHQTRPVILTMDVIASRDIEEGEEVIIDFELDGDQFKLRDNMVQSNWVE